MPSTTNFNWTTPADTDLVKDGAAAIRTLGNNIDASLVDLKGGTTNQILAKNSNTDLDFKWVSDATGMTNPMTTTGDIIYSSSGSTPARLGIGSTGNVLTVSGGLPVWQSAPAAGKLLQLISAVYSTSVAVYSTTFTDSGLSASITPSSTSSKVLVIVQQSVYSAAGTQVTGGAIRLLRGGTDVYTIAGSNNQSALYMDSGSGSAARIAASISLVYLDSPNTTSSTTYKTQIRARSTASGGEFHAQLDNASSSITLFEIGA